MVGRNDYPVPGSFDYAAVRVFIGITVREIICERFDRPSYRFDVLQNKVGLLAITFREVDCRNDAGRKCNDRAGRKEQTLSHYGKF